MFDKFVKILGIFSLAFCTFVLVFFSTKAMFGFMVGFMIGLLLEKIIKWEVKDEK